MPFGNGGSWSRNASEWKDRQPRVLGGDSQSSKETEDIGQPLSSSSGSIECESQTVWTEQSDQIEYYLFDYQCRSQNTKGGRVNVHKMGSMER